MAKVDLHTHTRFFHGFNSRATWYDHLGVRLLVRAARAHDLDAIALTNHDYYQQFDLDTGDLTVIPGIEVSTTLGHMLVVGADPPSFTKPRRLTPSETVALAHRHDCAAIVAHPFRDSTVVGSGADFDAVEINGKRNSTIDRISHLAAELEVPLVGGSDAHYPFEVGRTFTRVDEADVSATGIVDAIRDGRVDYHVDERHPSQALQHVYRLVHRLKGHEAPPPAEIDRSEAGPGEAGDGTPGGETSGDDRTGGEGANGESMDSQAAGSEAPGR